MPCSRRQATTARRSNTGLRVPPARAGKPGRLLRQDACFSAPRGAQGNATGRTREAVTHAFELLEHGWTATRPGA
ncbi:hypothetical protein [Streptomyces sp. ICC1]|uniref:hypothetical protein n=1 Tax=Streptomyces sp. ICC1 TaxID=2099583 RepID=UPI000DC76829|nr:hypothetical protein [Streptomyces sp. ICC1]AWZ07886.1 hypothetical protein DRB89_28400 [Streptomyces sp. ICC4]